MDNKLDSGGRRRGADPESDPTLIDYALAVWRRRWIILLSALGAGVLAFAWTSLVPAQYEVRVRLAVKTPSGPDDPAALQPALARLRASATSQESAAAVMKEAGVSRPDRQLSPAAFLRDHVSIEPSLDPNVAVLRAQASEPELAARIANLMAKEAVERVRTADQEQKTKTEESRKARLALAAARLEEAERRLRASGAPSRQGAAAVSRPVKGQERDERWRAELDYEVARGVYLEVASRIEEARLRNSVDRTEPVVLDVARPPGQPIDRRRIPITIAAVLAAVLLSVVGCLLADAFAQASARSR